MQVLAQALGGRGYEETNLVPQMLRDARSFLLSEGPSETLLMFTGARAIGGDASLQAFVADALHAPRVAAELGAAAERVAARSDGKDAGSEEARSNEAGARRRRILGFSLCSLCPLC